MNIVDLYRKIKKILDDSNTELVNKGLNKVNILSEIPSEIKKLEEINNLPYVLSKKIIEITEDDLSGATSIGSYAFYNCESLQSVTIPDSVTSIDNSAFAWCTSLESVTIPDSVTSIGGDAFYNCKSLASVTIGDSVTSMGNYAFSSCESLASVTIGDSVTFISDYAFYNCTSLASITIPDSVTFISNSAFNGCTSLASVTIGDSVTSIGLHAFYDCRRLTDIYLNPTTPPALRNTNAIPTTTTIHVPIGYSDSYKSATNWSYHSSRIVEDIVIE